MALNRKLATGVALKAWNYDTGNNIGQTIAAHDGHTEGNLVYVESLKCAEGTVNRIVINKANAEKLGFVIVED